MKDSSYHIFAWPFSFEYNKYIKKFQKANMKKTVDCWKQYDLSNDSIKDNSEQARVLYMVNQYLNQSAKDIYINHNDVCHLYNYQFEEDAQYYYSIQTRDKNQIDKSKTYRVPIQSIQLHLYQFGVGILFIKLHNCEYDTIDDFLAINDYGRRIRLPFIPKDTNGSIVADSLSIEKEINHKIVIKQTTNFKDFIKRFNGGQTIVECAKTCGFSMCMNDDQEMIASFLLGLVAGDFSSNENPYRIEPLSDDRMFVMSLIRNNELSNHVKKIETIKKDEKTDKEMDDFFNTLYKIIYVDPPGDITCQNIKMRDEALETSIYPRWSNYGTIQAVTYYSLVCITSAAESNYDSLFESVVKPFLEEYIFFVSLVVSQRAGIEIFMNKTGKYTNQIKSGLNLDSSVYRDVIDLKKKYIHFRNHILISEISTQIQGIELYRLMQKQGLVNEEANNLGEQIDVLNQLSDSHKQNRTNNIIALLAVLTSMLALEQFFPQQYNKVIIFIVSLLIVAINLFKLFSGTIFWWIRRK